MTPPLSVWKYYQLKYRTVRVVFGITLLCMLLQCALLLGVTYLIQIDCETSLKLLKAITFADLAKSSRQKQQALGSLLKQQATVAKVLPSYSVSIKLSIGEAELAFIKNPEFKALIRTLKLQLIKGRLPRAGSNEMVLHWRIAANQGWKIGDCFSPKYSETTCFTPQYRLTGLLDGPPLVGIADLDRYCRDYQTTPEKAALLILPRAGQLAQVKHYLERLAQTNPDLTTAQTDELTLMAHLNTVHRWTNALYWLITAVMTICAGFLFYLYFYQRQAEFGLLLAVGHTRQMIIRRALGEILLLNLLGFGIALGLSLLGHWALNYWFLQPQGLLLELWNPECYFQICSTPLFVTCCSIIPVWRLLKKVDPVLMVEGPGSPAKAKNISFKPLSIRKYAYHNQSTGGAVLPITFLSAVFQVALLVYATSMIRLYQRVEVEPWNALTYTGLPNAPADNQLAKELNQLEKSLSQQHSVVKVFQYSSIGIRINGVSICLPRIYFMKAREIQSVINVLNLKLIKGRLPTPGSNEVILHWQLAANRRLKIGDLFGQKTKAIPGGFRLVGLLDGQAILGFTDLEQLTARYGNRHNFPLLIIPQKNQLAQVKQYLTNLQQTDYPLYTPTAQELNCYRNIHSFRLLLIAFHLTIAAIVTLCVGLLFYLYFYQRRPEFGMLEALGHTRSMLIGRALREIFGVNLLGLGLGMAVTYLGGWLLNRAVFIKRGLPLVLWDPSYPWLLLPLPLLITVGSLIPVWRMVAKVDPIAMIEGEE